MKRRTFVRLAAAGAGSLALPGRLAAWPARVSPWLLAPMDDAQADHLKAYGVAFRALERGEKVEWLLNYRSGAFLLPADGATQRDAALAGVTTQPVDAGTVDGIRAEIMQSNMDAVPLEKAPKVAIYSPPNAAPWDDAVTMALNYAGVTFEKLWDREVIEGGLRDYDWLHLHHEDFTGQFSKFVLNYAGAPWLVDMMNRNKAMASALGHPDVPSLKRAVAQRLAAYVEQGGFLFACTSPGCRPSAPPAS